MSKSNKQTWYKQCTLSSPAADGSGKHVQVAWIPEQFAVVGRKVYFGKKTASPERIWEVDSASDNRISGDYLGERERDYLTQRAASDI